MSRGLPLLVFAVCAGLIGLIVFEFASSKTDDAAVAKAAPPTSSRPEPRPAPPKIADLVATGLAAPLFSPTRRPSEQSGDEHASDLGNVRLSGILIEPARRMAIFVAGTKPFILTEGETVENWRLDSITPFAVSLSGPEGSRTLEPKPDKSLVRPPAPVAASRQMSPANVVRPAFARQAPSANGMPPIAKMPSPGRPAGSLQDNAARSP